MKGQILYAIYENGRAIYIGVCSEGRLATREKEHRASGKIVGGRCMHPLQTYATRAEAEFQEAAMIREFKPTLNIAFNPDKENDQCSKST